MDHYSRLKRQVALYIAAGFTACGLVLIASWLLLNLVLPNSPLIIALILVAELALLALLAANITVKYSLEPVRFLWQAILHVSRDSTTTPAPNLDKSRVGRELVTALCQQVYQLASGNDGKAGGNSATDLKHKIIAADLPLPLVVLDKSQQIVFANDAMHRYLGINSSELAGKNFYDAFSLSFTSNDTLDNWLEDARAHTITSTRSWERVRLDRQDLPPLQFDMAAFYNKENPAKVETIITLFDHSDKYSQEDNSASYVAMAVHELRTPLTLLRGYIEVFEDELKDKLDDELADFMRKTRAQAEQLAAFVNNILNVARVEADQLTLSLHEENWNDIVKNAASTLDTRAKVQRKLIELELADNLPTVAADRVSIYEVLSNLIDNAIKYSGPNQKVVINTRLTPENAVETTIIDTGVGIAASVVPHLFEKFYRSHRTQQQVGGTGLGLYLSKAIVNAHSGNIWVRSKEGQGTTVGFTLKPYAQVADELKNSDNKEITRSAHGWIKNHSLNRR